MWAGVSRYDLPIPAQGLLNIKDQLAIESRMRYSL